MVMSFCIKIIKSFLSKLCMVFPYPPRGIIGGLLVFVFVNTSHAQDSLSFPTDTILLSPSGDYRGASSGDYRGASFFEKRWVQSTYIGVPLFAAGLIEKRENRHFRKLRNDFAPNYHNEIDNYIQYAPAVLPIVLKACGAESESSWSKMVTAEATSFALVTAVAQTMKRTVNEERPDGGRHSFPSGHTASAFMAATILSKEYGHYSPWVSIGAYSMATTTGLMRMLNNRHWMSDVLSGAGIGIVSAELGYWITDLIFKDEKKSYHPEKIKIVESNPNPSFFGVLAGFYLPLSPFNVAPGYSLEATTGGTFGFEGAYYPTRHFGIGARTAFSNISYILDGANQVEDTSRFYTLQVGPYVNIPIYGRLFAEGHLLAGMIHYGDAANEAIQLPKKNGLAAITGLSLGVRANRYLDVKATLDYGIRSPHTSQMNDPMHTLILTSSANIRF